MNAACARLVGDALDFFVVLTLGEGCLGVGFNRLRHLLIFDWLSRGQDGLLTLHSDLECYEWHHCNPKLRKLNEAHIS